MDGFKCKDHPRTLCVGTSMLAFDAAVQTMLLGIAPRNVGSDEAVPYAGCLWRFADEGRHFGQMAGF